MGRLEETKPFLKGYAERYLTRSKNGFYCCPVCGSGMHRHRDSDGALKIKYDGLSWKCFSCGEGGDLIDLIEKVENVPPEEAREKALLFSGQNEYKGNVKSKFVKVQEATPEPKINFKEFIEACIENIHLTDYPQKRGLSEATIKRYRLGYYDGKGKAQEIIKKLLGRDILAPALIIPYNTAYTYFIARSTLETEHERAKAAAEGKGKSNFNGKQKHDKPSSEKAGREPIYNPAALYNTEGKPVFITEAPLDALSYLEMGKQAIAIGGTGHEKLIDQLQNRRTENPLIIALDNDEAGKKAADRLEERLKETGYKPYRVHRQETDPQGNV